MLLTENKIRIIKTCNLYLCAISTGMAMSVLGPSLLDLQNIAKTDTIGIGLVFTGRSAGYLLGALIGGALFDATTRTQLLLMIWNLLITISLFAVPLCPNLGIMLGCIVLNGLAMGALDTGLNVSCLNLRGKDSGPFYQALHFTWGFGGLISPLIVGPFLENFEEDITDSLLSVNQTLILPNKVLNSTESALPQIHSIAYAYFIIGVYSLVITVLYMTTCIVSPIDKNAQKEAESETNKTSLLFVSAVVVTTGLLLFVQMGMEVGYAQIITTYVVKGPLALTKLTGSYISSTFWGAFTFGRLASIFLAMKFSGRSMIVIQLSLAFAGASVLLVWSESQEWSLWVASVLLGTGVASFWPSVVTWVERYITVTNKIVGILAAAAAFGEMLIPFFINSYIEVLPAVLSYVVTSSVVLSIVMTVVLFFILRNSNDKYSQKEKEGISNAAFESATHA